MGTLMPAPSVSVPQITFRSPRCASCSTSTRYLGRRPAWCSPMPCRSHLRISAPYGLLNSKSAITRGDLGLLLAGADLQAGEVLRAARRVSLGEVDDVGGRLASPPQVSRACARGGSRRTRTPAAPGRSPDFTVTVGRPFSCVRASSKNAGVAQRGGHQQEARLGQRRAAAFATPRRGRDPRSSGTRPSRRRRSSAAAPSRSAMLARISAVQQRMGASRLTVASPVERPTFSGPNSRHRAIHFSLTSALMGQV